MADDGQLLPVRVYQTADRIMVAAPMPGLEPDDISVVNDGRHVTLHGRERGPPQHDRNLLLAEWALGPYRRELDLTEPVDGTLAHRGQVPTAATALPPSDGRAREPSGRGPVGGRARACGGATRGRPAPPPGSALRSG